MSMAGLKSLLEILREEGQGIYQSNYSFHGKQTSKNISKQTHEQTKKQASKQTN
jgi:hypothetical protein